jgi:hypothetical protein
MAPASNLMCTILEDLQYIILFKNAAYDISHSQQFLIIKERENDAVQQHGLALSLKLVLVLSCCLMN